ncbi:outer membrane beta-barrel protein [Flammeovirga aprica]|uniref:Outer membrane beta-barrel protein n=1 Tax=Flammeovirga aprica JL-4 TaxID=694437 RepID=A0A7X9RU40_9BACT|nr:outer membrane beta-barrel protein [Flammeovirga aprica]NME68477.1 outer membrane beta-barrel protein [Flammeovirga aprica JL-4]
MYFFKTSIRFFLFLLLFTQTIGSSIAQSCEELYVRANAMYLEGKLLQVPLELEECITLGYETEAKQTAARRLVILSYLYSDKLPEAEEEMLNLLKEYPEYKPAKADPAELKKLYEKFRTRPIMTFGILAGLTYNQAFVDQTYGVGKESLHENVQYNPKVNFKVGVSFSYLLSKQFQLNISPSYENITFETNEKALDFSSTVMTENQSWLHVPVILRWVIAPNTQLKPFIGVGGAMRYLLSANIEGAQSFDESGIADIEPSPIDIKDQRKEMLYEATAQIGFQIKSRMTHWDIFATYTYALSTFNKPNTRYDNPELIFSYGFVDNDTRLNVLALNIVFSYDFYKPKVLRKYKNID